MAATKQDGNRAWAITALLLLLASAPFLWFKIRYDFRTGLSTVTPDLLRGWQFFAGFLPVIGAVAALWALARWLASPWGRPVALAFSRALAAAQSKPAASLWALALATLVSAFVLDNKALSMGVFVILYMIQAIGLNITVGMTGLLVLGYAGFFAVGAYLFAIANHFAPWVSWWMALPCAFVAGGAVGWVVGLPCLRLRGDYLAIVTLGFAESFRELVRNLTHLTGGDKGLVISAGAKITPWPGMNSVQTAFLVSALVLAGSAFLVHRVYHSRIGRAWRAIKSDETAAQAMGISVVNLKLMAFSMSASYAAMAGVLYAGFAGFIDPSACAFEQSVLVLAMVILGGLGSMPGALLGSALLYLIPTLLRDQFPQIADYRLLIFGAIMVAMMLYRPQGLLGGDRRPGGAA